MTFVWNNFGNIMGAAVIGGVNAAIRAINVMVSAAKTAINTVINLANKIPGVNIEPTDPSKSAIKEMDNPAAADLSKANVAHVAEIKEILASDPIGAIGKTFSGSTPAAQNFSVALGGINGELDEMGSKGKGGKLDKVKDGVKSAAKEMDRFVDAIAGAMSNAFQGLIDGSKSVKETLADLLKQLSSMLMNEGFKALVGGLFGGGSGGGLFAGIGKLLGFASGGTIMPGGAGGIDSQVVAFRKSPNERVDITKPGQTLHSGGVQEVMIRGVFVDDGGVIKAQVTSMGKQAAQAGAAVAVNQVNQSLPSMLANAQTRSM